MKKSILRSVGLALSLAMVTGGFVGCKSKDTKETVTKVENGAVVKPTIIKMTTDTFLKPEDGMDEFLAGFKKQTGMELKVTQPVHNQYYDKLSLQFASGDVPDVVEIASTYLTTFGSNGALWDMLGGLSRFCRRSLSAGGRRRLTPEEPRMIAIVISACLSATPTSAKTTAFPLRPTWTQAAAWSMRSRISPAGPRIPGLDDQALALHLGRRADL